MAAAALEGRAGTDACAPPKKSNPNNESPAALCCRCCGAGALAVTGGGATAEELCGAGPGTTGAAGISPKRSTSGFAFLEGTGPGCTGTDDVRKEADLSSFAFSCTMFSGYHGQLCCSNIVRDV